MEYRSNSSTERWETSLGDLTVPRKPYLGISRWFAKGGLGTKRFQGVEKVTVKLAGGFTPEHITSTIPDPEGSGSMKVALRGNTPAEMRDTAKAVKEMGGKPSFRSSTFRIGAVEASSQTVAGSGSEVRAGVRKTRVTRPLLEKALANAEKSTGPFTRVNRTRLVKTKTGVSVRRNNMRWDTGLKKLSTRGLKAVKKAGKLGVLASFALGRKPKGETAREGMRRGAKEMYGIRTLTTHATPAMRSSKGVGSW